MPSVLAIETSTSRGGVALVRDGAMVFGETFTSERSHNSQLFAPIGEALTLAGNDLLRIVVGLGPGSYTGARIGIAAAQGIALSRGAAVFGLPSVLAPDMPEPSCEFVACGDARRGSYFIAQIRGESLDGEITLHDREEFLRLRAADTTRTWLTFDQHAPLELPDIRVTVPSAARLALIASEMTDEDVWSLEQQPLEPVYLRAPFITMPRAKTK
jgi:tRNA threonylcarbamoyl adenosine modification protein YeaZ